MPPPRGRSVADAEIIPIGTGGRPGRGSGSARPSEASRTLSGGARPAAQRRPSREQPEPTTVDDVRPAATIADRAPAAGISPAQWLAALQTGAAEVFGDDWEPRLARFLAFL